MLIIQRGSCVVGNAFEKNRKPESSFCYDKAVPEEIIEKLVGISLAQKDVGDNSRCHQAKGAVLCATCSGSGLYVDYIMESQGIIVKIRCLESYLANLSLYPGKSQLSFVPSNTQAVILKPLGDKGIAVIGGDIIRGFTTSDQWLILR